MHAQYFIYQAEQPILSDSRISLFLLFSFVLFADGLRLQNHTAKNFNGFIRHEGWTCLSKQSIFMMLKIYMLVCPFSIVWLVGWWVENLIEIFLMCEIWCGSCNFRLCGSCDNVSLGFGRFSVQLLGLFERFFRVQVLLRPVLMIFNEKSLKFIQFLTKKSIPSKIFST